jgi:hypothetical protein
MAQAAALEEELARARSELEASQQLAEEARREMGLAQEGEAGAAQAALVAEA